MKNVVSFALRSDGQEFSEGNKVKSIVITNEANRIPRATILLLDGDVSKQDFLLSNKDFFKPGRKLEIDIGFESKNENVFKGIIVRSSIRVRESGASHLEITCKHPMAKLTTRKTNRFFYDMSDQEAITQILDETGLQYSVNGISGVTHTQLVQYESTSWDFVLSRMDANGGIAIFDVEKFSIVKPSVKEKEVLDCQYGTNVLRFDAGMDSEDQFPKVEGKSWSSADQDLITVGAEKEYVSEIGNITSQELSEVLNDAPFQLQHTANLREEELTVWANSKAAKNELSKVQGNVTILGHSGITPGKVIKLSGFGERFSGKAFVTGVRHEVTQGNWTTSIQFGLPSTWFSQRQDFNSLPAAGMLPSVNGLQIGVVTKLEGDPDNEFRIKVKIPIINGDDDGIWAQVSKIYAGDKYGICFYPELEDEVVIGFLNDDPRKAVMLGVLHSSAKASPLSQKDDNHMKGIISREGLKIIFDDEKKSLRVTTPAGNEIKLDDQGKSILFKDVHGNKIEMNSQGITLQSPKSIKLKADMNIQLEGLNVTAKASGKFAAEGAGGAEVKSSAIAVLKGTLVQIN